jgi:uncharacterized protein YbcI
VWKRGGERILMPIAGTPTEGTRLAQVSNGLVALHSKYYGKGPTEAKSYLLDDTVICVLRGGFTTVERTLIDTGRSDAVLQIRREFQGAMEEEFRGVVEQALGRGVTAYISQVHTEPDLAIELFMLEPSTETLIAKHEQRLDGSGPDGSGPAH